MSPTNSKLYEILCHNLHRFLLFRSQRKYLSDAGWRMFTTDFLVTYQNKLETNQIRKWLYYHFHQQNTKWSSVWLFPDYKCLQ